MKLTAIVRRMTEMCDSAWYIFMRGIQLSCVMLFCALLLLLGGRDPMLHYQQLMTAQALYETPQSLLLICLILSVCLEDHNTRS